jgi:hypothetical protein
MLASNVMYDGCMTTLKTGLFEVKALVLPRALAFSLSFSFAFLDMPSPSFHGRKIMSPSPTST